MKHGPPKEVSAVILFYFPQILNMYIYIFFFFFSFALRQMVPVTDV